MPISMLPQHHRFQKIKIEETTPGSPIIGSSPKKSWFSSFFSKAEKEQQSNPPPYGIYTKKSIFEITSELQRVFKKLHISYEVLSTQSMKAKSKLPAVKFDVEISKTGLEGSYFVSFIVSRGSADDYHTVCEAVEFEIDP